MEDVQEVDYVGKFQIYCTWILSKKGDGIRAWIVERGLEEPYKDSSVFPTVDEDGLRIHLVQFHGWPGICSTQPEC